MVSFRNTCDEFLVINQMMLMDSKDLMFDVIKSEFMEKQFPIKITFEEYAIYITSLKDDIIYSTECIEFYSNFMKYKKIIKMITLNFSSLVFLNIKLIMKIIIFHQCMNSEVT